jgi:hypothetical protein
MRGVDRLLRGNLGHAERIEIGYVGRVGFCQPEESAASMVMETSARVCVCQLLRPRELKMPSTDSELEKIPAV